MIRLLSVRSWFCVAAFVLCMTVGAAAQAVDRAQLLEELRAKAGLTDEDLQKLEDGEIVIKELDRLARREVAVIGVVRLEFAFEFVRQGFERTVTTQRRESAREYGRFSDPPVISDMNSLEFDESDIDDLRECRVGDCEWNLSEKLIRDLGSGVDWNSENARKRASEVLKSGLISYLGGYIREGSQNLMVYRDTETAVSLAEEFEGLTRDMILLDRFDKRFADFVRGYPSGRPPGATDFFNWSEVKVGFKPVVMITHTLQTERTTDGGGVMLNGARQIFANHYFDSSLGITGLFGFPAEGGRPETYVVFVNRSRASALRGRIGGLLRGLIEDQAKGKLKDFMEDTKKYTALASANRASAEQRKEIMELEAEPPWYYSWTVIAVAALLAAGIGFLILRRLRG